MGGKEGLRRHAGCGAKSKSCQGLRGHAGREANSKTRRGLRRHAGCGAKSKSCQGLQRLQGVEQIQVVPGLAEARRVCRIGLEARGLADAGWQGAGLTLGGTHMRMCA